MKKVLLLIILLNISCFILAFAVDIPLPFEVWRKGPPMHSFSAYSSGNASGIFWVATAGLLDLYFLMIFLFHYIAIKNRITMQKWFHFLIILVALGLSFFVTEHAVRLFIKYSPWYTQFRPHPFLYWWNRPNLRNFVDRSDKIPKSTNASGFRYKEDIAYEKTKDEYRIFVLGDSSTFGHGVRDNKTFAAQLEKMFDDRYRRKILVINAACPGHTTYQNLIELRQMVLPFHPDMVIVANNNDHALEYMEEKKRAYTTLSMQRLNTILYHSDYYLLFRRVISDIKVFVSTKLKIIPYPSLTRRVSLEDYKDNIKEMMKIAKKNNFQLVFIKMPINIRTLDLFPELKKKCYDKAYPETLSLLCREENQRLVDADAEWSKNPEKGLYEIFRYNGYKTDAPYHPSEKGHLRIAKQIFDFIDQKELIANKSATGAGVEARLKYFIPSDRQDAFDELHCGRVINISKDKAEIAFTFCAEKIKNADRIGVKDLAKVFYEKGAVPLEAYEIVPIERYGEAKTEPELFRIDHYIEGKLSGDMKEISVLFDVKDHLTYMPQPISAGNIVNVVYSQGLRKPPLARRIVKNGEYGVGNRGALREDAEYPPLEDRINERFYMTWFSLGKGLWKKVAHLKKGTNDRYEAANDLFKKVTVTVAKDLGISRDTVIKAIDRKAYINEK
ncbi:MAG: hypothetical protein A2Z72_04685 [Omnitrophica bacterium RBG_13_46_9]|nr:MAG: hypothetical protein A2Z72_04685 [Omnitrophica bacterium RBG_13_46_9]